VVILSSQHRPQKDDEFYSKSRTKFKKSIKEKNIIDSDVVDLDNNKEFFFINNDENDENSYSFHQKQFDDFLSQDRPVVDGDEESIDKNIVNEDKKEEEIIDANVIDSDLKEENISVVTEIDQDKIKEVDVVEKVNDELEINIDDNDVKNNENSEEIVDSSVFEEIVEIITTTSEIKFDEEDDDDNNTASSTYKPPIAHQQIITPIKNSDSLSKTPNKLQSMMSKFKNAIKLDHSNTTVTDQIKENKNLFGRNKSSSETSEIDSSLIDNINNTKKSEKNVTDAEDDGYAWVDPDDEDDGLTELTINGEVKLFTAQELYFLVLEELLLLRIELEGKNKKSIFGNHKMWF
jgi:hypothetical protein